MTASRFPSPPAAQEPMSPTTIGMELLMLRSRNQQKSGQAVGFTTSQSRGPVTGEGGQHAPPPFFTCFGHTFNKLSQHPGKEGKA